MSTSQSILPWPKIVPLSFQFHYKSKRERPISSSSSLFLGFPHHTPQSPSNSPLTSCGTQGRHFAPHDYHVSFHRSQLNILSVKFEVVLANNQCLSVNSVRNPSLFVEPSPFLQIRVFWSHLGKWMTLRRRLLWFKVANDFIFKEFKKFTVYFGIKYTLYKLCVTVGRLAPVDSGWLKIYSQYLVNSTVTLYWI